MSDSLGNALYNPLNIREGYQVFQGEITPKEGFKQFISFDYGIRAACKILITYFKKYKLDTVTKIISRYAPEADNNDTTAYIASVAKYMGVGPDDPIDVMDLKTMQLLVNAMAIQENPVQFTQNQLLHGVRMALDPLAS